MMSIDHTIHRIKAYAGQQGWRKARLAKEAGLCVNTLRGMDKPGWNPRTDTLRRLEALVPADFMPVVGDAA